MTHPQQDRMRRVRQTRRQGGAVSVVVAWLLSPSAFPASPATGPTGIPLGPGSYGVIDLGDFGTAFAQAFDLNDGARVVGTAQDSNHWALGFVWEHGTITPLPTLSGGTPVAGRAVNSLGEVAGTAWRPLPEGGARQEAFRWQGGPLEPLALPANGGSAEALDINDAGLVVGSVVVTQAWSLGNRLITRPAGWPRAGGVSLLTSEPMAHGRALGVNSAGQVVGTFQTGYPASLATHAVFFEGGGVRDIHTLVDHVHSVATAINDGRQVVGYAYTVDNRLYDFPFLWTEEGGMRLLPRPPGAPYGQAQDITDNGLIAGYLRNDGPVLWLDAGQPNETYVTLQQLVGRNSPYRLNGPVAVNKWGEVAATAGYEGTRAVLLTPTNLVDRIDGTLRLHTVSVESTNFFASTNALADVRVELLGLLGTDLTPIATSFTDADGRFTLLARQELYQRYATRFTLQDGKGWLDLYDAGSDTNQPAWLRTPAFDTGRSSRMDVVLGVNLDSTNADPNDVTYFFNENNTLVGPAGDAQPAEAAVNTEVRHFPHLALVYRNLRLAAEFAEDHLGLDMPRIRVEAFTPGYWEWGPWSATADPNVAIRSGSWEPTSFFSYEAVTSSSIVFPDLRSLMNPPGRGFGVPGNADGFSYADQTINLTTGGLTLRNGTLCGRDRPDNREFHEYAHYIMYVSSVAGEADLPPWGANDQNHAGLANSTSADSWTEGWAEFLSAVISDVMLGRSEKPVSSEYLFDGTSANLDDLMTYLQVRAGNEHEELLISSLLWDLHDPSDPVEGDTISLGLSQWWGAMSAAGPALTDFQEVYLAFDGYARQNPPGLSAAALQDRWVGSYVFDDLSLPAGSPGRGNGLFEPGETVGETSWNPSFPNRPGRLASQFLQLEVVTSSGEPVSDVTYRVAIEYEAPFESRDRLMMHPTGGAGGVLVPLLLPPLPSRAVITAWKGEHQGSAELVIPSGEFWRLVATVPEVGEKSVLLEHAFTLDDLRVVLRALRLPDGQVKVSWENTSTDWQLESATSLGPSAPWTPVAGAPVLEADRWTVVRPALGQAAYYRLRAE